MLIPRTQKWPPPGVPNCLKTRRLLNEKELSPALCRQYAEAFLVLGWLDDALDFFQKANDAAGLERIKAHCLETGDAFLLGRLRGEAVPELWRVVGEKALSLEKLYFALRAFEAAGDTDKAQEVSSRLAPGTPKA
jgi:hypothetical protein